MNRERTEREGTSHFVSVSAAVEYFAMYAINESQVKEKIRTEQIKIGAPVSKPGWKTYLDHAEGRYMREQRT